MTMRGGGGEIIKSTYARDEEPIFRVKRIDFCRVSFFVRKFTNNKTSFVHIALDST